MDIAAGRRERKKEDKRARILAAAGELFAQHGLDSVTTQQVAEAANIGAGTLFLYAATKSELLLMVENALYAESLSRGVEAAAREDSPVAAVMALLTPLIACNRAQVSNGRAYLREILFGDPSRTHHRQARQIVSDSEEHLARILRRTRGLSPETAIVTARAISALVMTTLAAFEMDGEQLEAVLMILRHDVAAMFAAS